MLNKANEIEWKKIGVNTSKWDLIGVKETNGSQ
jgi:hypothetical protein